MEDGRRGQGEESLWVGGNLRSALQKPLDTHDPVRVLPAIEEFLKEDANVAVLAEAILCPIKNGRFRTQPIPSLNP